MPLTKFYTYLVILACLQNCLFFSSLAFDQLTERIRCLNYLRFRSCLFWISADVSIMKSKISLGKSNNNHFYVEKDFFFFVRSKWSLCVHIEGHTHACVCTRACALVYVVLAGCVNQEHYCLLFRWDLDLSSALFITHQTGILWNHFHIERPASLRGHRSKGLCVSHIKAWFIEVGLVSGHPRIFVRRESAIVVGVSRLLCVHHAFVFHRIQRSL